MHLAILMTNTDESDFAQRHPKDGAKFASLIHWVRPDWQLEVFSVKDDIFPEDLGVFDGALITGSPASVNDPAPWVGKLIGQLRDAIAREIPLFGVCFGHQALAKALGVEVVQNPKGWVFGRTTMKSQNRPDWARDLPDTFDQYAVHEETHDPRQEHHKGINDALDERHRHHVAVRDMTHLMREHSFDLVLVHVVQQTHADGHERIVATGARSERIRFG